MGKQDTLRNLLIAGAVFLLIMSVGPILFPPPPPRPPVDPTVAPVTPAPPSTEYPRDLGNASPTAEAAKTVESSLVAVEAESVSTLEMGAASNIASQGRTRPSDPYRMRLVLSNVGAAVESAERVVADGVGVPVDEDVVLPDPLDGRVLDDHVVRDEVETVSRVERGREVDHDVGDGQAVQVE